MHRSRADETLIDGWTEAGRRRGHSKRTVHWSVVRKEMQHR